MSREDLRRMGKEAASFARKQAEEMMKRSAGEKKTLAPLDGINTSAMLPTS